MRRALIECGGCDRRSRVDVTRDSPNPADRPVVCPWCGSGEIAIGLTVVPEPSVTDPASDKPQYVNRSAAAIAWLVPCGCETPKPGITTRPRRGPLVRWCRECGRDIDDDDDDDDDGDSTPGGGRLLRDLVFVSTAAARLASLTAIHGGGSPVWRELELAAVHAVAHLETAFGPSSTDDDDDDD